MLKFERFATESDWLNRRMTGISATDVGAILGMNAFGKTAMDVYMKCVFHREKAMDKKNPVLVRGHKLEPLIRKSFAVDYEDTYKVTAPPSKGNWIWYDDKRPYLLGSLDGILTKKADKKKGILEIKTTDITKKSVLDNWDNGIIPDQYMCQVLTYLAITKYQFAVLRARMRIYSYDPTHGRALQKVETRDYYFDSEELKPQIDYLLKQVDDFWNGNVLKRLVPDVKVI